MNHRLAEEYGDIAGTRDVYSGTRNMHKLQPHRLAFLAFKCFINIKASIWRDISE